MTINQPGYRYDRLTTAIDDKTSPLRQYLNTTFPNTRLITGLHNQTSPPIAVPGTPGVNPGTIGTAFDVLIGLRYQPNTIPGTARPFARWKPDLADGWANILNLVAEDQTFTEAAAWAYALAIEAHRSPGTPYPIAALLDEKGGYNEYDLLAIASAEAIEELANLEALAEDHLYPHLGTPPIPDANAEPGWRRTAAWSSPDKAPDGTQQRFGPTFTASTLCAADADLIHGDTLYEFKSGLGTKRTDGTRVDALPLGHLYQAITYALFDTHDEHGIRNIVLYSARYGRHTPGGRSTNSSRPSQGGASTSPRNGRTSGTCSEATPPNSWAPTAATLPACMRRASHHGGERSCREEVATRPRRFTLVPSPATRQGGLHARTTRTTRSPPHRRCTAR